MENNGENKGGRPALFETDEQLKTKVDEYFDFIKGAQSGGVWIELPEPATITGLALYLGFESRQSFYDYEEKDEFSYTIKRARMRIENQYEKNLSGNNCTGSIFALKNLGWKDKTEQDLNVSGGIVWQEQKRYETK